jgi:bifunctional non-homologous end joining protein LigD
VADVTFTEWTADGRLRHPQYLGLRDDIPVGDVKKEPLPKRGRAAAVSAPPVATPASSKAPRTAPKALETIIKRLEAIERGAGDGVLELPGGHALDVTHLAKVFWPRARMTKGELMRYYVQVSPALLPAVADRPLVMRRFPNGVTGKAFYQQRAPARVPAGVRVEVLPSDTVVPSRLIGGTLMTLLYMTQLAVISQDPWFSRVQSPDFADHVAFDLDPMPGVTFATVLDVARWIHDELEALGIPSVPKTSGGDGFHIYVPLPPRTPYEAGRLFCEIVATVVVRKHPRVATVTRAVNARGRRVYIDCLQNIRAKTLATAYSARATEAATVSAPVTWEEAHAGVEREAFTIHTMPARLAEVGDLWARLRTSKPADLSRVLRLAK